MKFRIRHWGDSEWTYIEISGDLEAYISGAVGAALNQKILHVQMMVDGEWENL